MAVAGVDYINFSQTIQLTTANSAVGELCRTINVIIINDDLVENVECFTVQFLLGDQRFSGVVVINNGVLVYCIEDDDSKYTRSPSLCPLSPSLSLPLAFPLHLPLLLLFLDNNVRMISTHTEITRL